MTPAEALGRAVALADLRVVRCDEVGRLTRWRLARLVKRAAFELGLQLPPPGQAHVADRDPVAATVAVLQTAWLRLHRIALPPSLRLREATHERYWAEVGRRAPRARSSRTRALVVGGLVAIAAGSGVALALGGGDEGAPFSPISDTERLAPEREAVWIEALTDWVVALDRLARARHEGELPSRIEEHQENLGRVRRAVLADDLRPVLGDEVLQALATMLDAAEPATLGGSGWEEREEAFAEAVRELNRALLKKGYDYFFDSYAVRYDDGRAEAAIYAFAVLARRGYLIGEKPIQALHLRRLDRLNIVQLLLGYTSRRMDVAVLLVDKLESEVATRLGPALEPGREMPLRMSDEGEGTTSWLDVRKKAGQVVREAFYGALPGEQQALSELGVLLARRNDLVVDWNLRLEPKNVTLRELETLVVDADYRDRFESLTSPEARAVLDGIQKKLETPEHHVLYLRLVARHSRPVELHEVQHRIDYASGDDFVTPVALLQLLGIPEDSDSAESEEVRRIAYELSAYTAELARDPEWARVNLTLLSEHLYDGSGGAEGWCAVLILEGLGKELGLSFVPILKDGNGADLERVAALHLQLLGQPGERLANAAAKLWAGWYGQPLVRAVPAR